MKSACDMLLVMTVEVVHQSEAPKRIRTAAPRLMKSPDWNNVLRQMLAGVKPDQVILYKLTAAEMAEYHVKDIKAAGRTIKSVIRKGRLPYAVSAKKSEDGGVVVIYPIND
jgi:hypothetical protein